MPDQIAVKPVLYCSFCGQSQNEVKALITGPTTANICDLCVVLCAQILTDRWHSASNAEVAQNGGMA